MTVAVRLNSKEPHPLSLDDPNPQIELHDESGGRFRVEVDESGALLLIEATHELLRFLLDDSDPLHPADDDDGVVVRYEPGTWASWEHYLTADEHFAFGQSFVEDGDPDARADEHFQEAANAGHTGAMIALAETAADRGDDQLAREWWKTAAQCGDTDAMCQLAIFAFQDDNRKKAHKWFRRAAELDNPLATRSLGWLAYQEDGDLALAEEWLLRAADLGDIESMSRLGHIKLLQGDLEACLRWHKRALSLGDAPLSNACLGVLAERDGNEKRARRYYRRAAQSGQVVAMLSLGAFAEQSRRPRLAAYWYGLAREHGNREGALYCGGVYSSIGFHDIADRYWAEAGFDQAGAQNRLGELYSNRGDTTTAVRWWQKSAAAGSADARLHLGSIGAWDEDDEPSD